MTSEKFRTLSPLSAFVTDLYYKAYNVCFSMNHLPFESGRPLWMAPTLKDVISDFEDVLLPNEHLHLSSVFHTTDELEVLESLIL